MKNNIPWYALVRDIQIEPGSNDLLLATHGRGILIVDNIKPMRQLTPEVARQDVVILPQPDMPVRNGISRRCLSPPGRMGWRQCTRPRAHPVLPERPRGIGRRKVDILDKTVSFKSLPGGKRKGLNKGLLGHTRQRAKTATGSTKPDQSGFVALALPELTALN